ncbi:hypothetical protein F5Y06DRAFT_89079 [Hypoxylon sp. FL0890]|nr:hypothetical protein F5Y06DRAFT_89079 [Hypoxylon sp. FL0890]
MKFFTAIMGAALAATGVSAQQAIVKNNCQETIYVQSFPYDGSTAGPLTTLNHGDTFSEAFRPSGSTIKLATTKTLTSPLFFGYSFSTNPDYAYCKCTSVSTVIRIRGIQANIFSPDEFSTEWGNPFANFHNILTPGAGCEEFDCAAGQADCYSTPSQKKVYGCPQPVTLEADLCV